MKKSSSELIDTIEKNKALTERELQEKLHYKKGSLNRRLRRMTMFGLIDYVIISPSSLLAKYSFIKGYTSVRVYFIDRDDLKWWAVAKIPLSFNLFEREAIMKVMKKELKIKM